MKSPKFWLVIAALWVVMFALLDSPEVDQIRQRNQSTESRVRPDSPAATLQGFMQSDDGEGGILSGAAFLVVAASAVVFVLSRLMGIAPGPPGQMSNRSAQFVAMMIGIIICAVLLG